MVMAMEMQCVKGLETETHRAKAMAPAMQSAPEREKATPGNIATATAMQSAPALDLAMPGRLARVSAMRSAMAMAMAVPFTTVTEWAKRYAPAPEKAARHHPIRPPEICPFSRRKGPARHGIRTKYLTLMSDDLYAARIEGAEIPFRWKSGSNYVILAKVGDSGYVVSQHVTPEATYNEWVRLKMEHWIIPRTEAAYDEFVAEYPDAVASGYDEGESEI